MGRWNRIPKIYHWIGTYRVKTFVETGTGAGGGVNAALRHGFKEIYSVDAFKKAANQAKKLFARQPNVVISENTSENFLKELLPSMDSRPIFFWLDAHFPGEFHGVKRNACKDMRIRSPLQYELEVIFKEREKYGFPDIIGIDDLRMFKRSFFLQKQSLVRTTLSDIQAIVPEGLLLTTHPIDQGYILIRNPNMPRQIKLFL